MYTDLSFLCQHTCILGLVHCNSNLRPVVQADMRHTTQYPEKINTDYQ